MESNPTADLRGGKEEAFRKKRPRCIFVSQAPKPGAAGPPCSGRAAGAKFRDVDFGRRPNREVCFFSQKKKKSAGGGGTTGMHRGNRTGGALFRMWGPARKGGPGVGTFL